MMGKTHLTMGIAIATLVLHPNDVPSCLVAIAGGAIGGVVADIDTVRNDYKHDALMGQVLAISVFCVSLLIDYIAGFGIAYSISNQNRVLVITGIVGYLVLYIMSFFCRHRTFTHSLLALVLYTISVCLVCPGMAIPYAIGYMVHLILDILNKKPVPLFFPKGKGFCLGWFYANRSANKCLGWIGLATSVFLIINSTIMHVF